MPDERFLFYILAAAMLLLKVVTDALQRWRLRRMAQQAEHEPVTPRPASLQDALVRQARVEPSPPRIVATTTPPRRKAKSEKPAAARPPRPMRVEPAKRHRLALGDRAELRRAMELVAILGPPRSRVPEDR